MILAHYPDRADVRGPWSRAMVEFEPEPPRRKARHVTPAVQFPTHIIRKQAQIYLLGLNIEDRFRFRAVKWRPPA